MHLRWSEHDGPPVPPPRRRGFGTRLITQGLRDELDCTVSLDFNVAGVVCTLDIPLPEPGP
ncbi:hypothetical protein [Luteimonas cucumeris]|uniref:hypothetical protein n=1 Tax=Luteimonas cucumeris TaxID=985012 RepID=UPI0011A5E627|nr:hypothetical protein [Luteimonas cucumeris]